MSISISDGNIPYYGVFNNKAIHLNAINDSTLVSNNNGAFHYIFPWEITFNNSTYYAVFNNCYLYLYDKNPSTNYKIRDYINSSGATKLEKVYMAVQPYYKIDLLNPCPSINESTFNARVYLYEHDDFVFFHFDYIDSGALEIIVTKNGYIQYNSLGDARAYNAVYFGVKEYYASLSSGCDSCAYSENCSSYNSSNTSCVAFGTTFTEASTYHLALSDKKFLLTPLSSEIGFNINTTQHLDLTSYLNVSEGELSLVANKNSHKDIFRIPLRSSKNTNTSNLSIRANNSNKFIAFSDDVSGNTFSDYSPLRLFIDGSVKSPYLPRVASYNHHILYDLDWEQNNNIKFYTLSSGSSYRYYTGALLYTLTNRIKVKQIRLHGSLYRLGSNSYSENVLPSSSYPNIMMMINTSSNNLTTNWTPSNVDQSITFNAGYIGSGGKLEQLITVVKNVNMYIKQFTFTPAYAGTSTAYSDKPWFTFYPEYIELVEYSTGNTYYYTL